MIRHLIILGVFLLALSQNLFATPLGKETFIRDAEIEEALRAFANPIFKAAKLNPKDVHLYIINSPVINAFTPGQGIVVFYTGLLLNATSALQVAGVLAHETAHVAHHHIISNIAAMEKAALQNLLGTVGGLALGALTGKPEMATAVLMGSQDVAARSYLHFSRTQECAADQGAVGYLDSLGWPSDGLLDFMNILHHGDVLINPTGHLDPYLLTHPVLPERISFFRNHISKSSYTKGDFPQKIEKDFKRIQVKLKAFTQPPLKTLQEFPASDTSLLGRYARAIAYLQNSQEDEALKEINTLLKEYPHDPFFWDLKGQILFESGKPGEAATAYEKAVALRPNTPLLSIALAQALVESSNSSHLEKAYPLLLRAKTEEPDNALVYRLLGIYYGKKENTGMAALSLAEMAFHSGDMKQAIQQATRAIHFLKNDPVNLTRARDVLEEAEEQNKPPSSSPF